MAKSEPKPYESVESKIATLETSKTALTSAMNTAPEDQKAGLQEQINEADRKIRWYQGRQKSAKFQAKAAAAVTPAAPTTEATPAPTADPSTANVANQS
jgi:hypothetical protein